MTNVIQLLKHVVQCVVYSLNCLYKDVINYKDDIHYGLYCWEPLLAVRLHAMQRMVLLSQFCLSVRLSDACIVTKLNDVLRIFWYHTKLQLL